jgi:hypothetical protein
MTVPGSSRPSKWRADALSRAAEHHGLVVADAGSGKSMGVAIALVDGLVRTARPRDRRAREQRRSGSVLLNPAGERTP